MANFIFNVSKGRGVEYYNRVKSNDPANSAFVVVILSAAGLETDAVLIDKATLADVVVGTTDEATNTNYVRKVFTDVELAALTIDNTNDRVDLQLPTPLSWAAVAAGSNWAKMLVCYDSDTTLGTDANIVPIAAYDVSLTPDGSTLNINLNAAGWLRAQ